MLPFKKAFYRDYTSFDLNEDEKDGLLSMLSDRALNVLNLISSASSMVFIHGGINPI